MENDEIDSPEWKQEQPSNVIFDSLSAASRFVSTNGSLVGPRAGSLISLEMSLIR